MTTSNRNFAVDWIKGLMILIIVLYHSARVHAFPQGYLAVDLFFVLSGYYLMRHFDVSGGQAWEYTLSRLKKIMPPYVVCLFIAVLLHFKVFFQASSWEDIVKILMSANPFTRLPVENVVYYIPFTALLSGTWFISIMIVAGYVLYAMLAYDKNLSITLLIPVSCLMGYNWLFSSGNSIANWELSGVLTGPFVRGYSGMALGICLYWILVVLKGWFEKYSFLTNVLFVLSLFFFLSLMYFEKPQDIWMMVLLPMIIPALMIEKGWLNTICPRLKGSIMAWVGGYSLEILLTHYLVWFVNTSIAKRLLTPYYNDLLLTVCDVVGTLIAAVALNKFCSWMGNNKRCIT